MNVGDWSNSFDSLVEGKTIKEKNALLLWKHDAEFETLFMTENSPQGSTRKRGSPTQRSPTIRKNIPTPRLDQNPVNLSKDLF